MAFNNTYKTYDFGTRGEIKFAESNFDRSDSFHLVALYDGCNKEFNASLGLLVSKAFPAKEKDFVVQLDRKIWLCKPGSEVTSIVKILRDIVLASHRAKAIDEFSTPEMHEEVFNFITNHFTDHVNEVMRTQDKLRTELEAEKRAFTTKWKTRETLINRMGDSVYNMAGTLLGMGVPSVKLEQLTNLIEDK